MSEKNGYNTFVRSVIISFVLWYLRFFSSIALRLNTPSLIIGIAGSVGKSSTRDTLHTLLKNAATVKTVGNSETGIPLGILGIKPVGFGFADWILMLMRVPIGIFFLRGTRILIVEMGIDDPFPPKNMEYLLQIIKPHIGIIVNESAAHTMQFEKALTQKERELSASTRVNALVKYITKEDVKMVRTKNCKIVIYNADNSTLATEIETVETSSHKKLLSFGADNKNDLSYKSYDVDLDKTTMEFIFEKKTLIFTTKFLLPRAYQEVIGGAFLAAIASRNELGEKTDPQELLDNLAKNFSLPKGRGSIFSGINGSILIDSSYNASKLSVLTYLDLLADIKKKTGRKTIGIIGDMRELGNEAEFEHQEVAEKIKEVCDEIYLIGNLTKKYILPYVEKFDLTSKWFETNLALGEYLKENLAPESTVLVKGSQNTIFLEETIKYLLLNSDDFKKLCRQDNYWIAAKRSQNKLYHY